MQYRTIYDTLISEYKAEIRMEIRLARNGSPWKRQWDRAKV